VQPSEDEDVQSTKGKDVPFFEGEDMYPSQGDGV